MTRQGLFRSTGFLVCPRARRRDRLTNRFGAIGRTEDAMRIYVETIGMVVGLLAAYFALLPLTI